MDLELLEQRAIERLGYAQNESEAEPWREIFFAASAGNAAVEEIIRRYPEYTFMG